MKKALESGADSSMHASPWMLPNGTNTRTDVRIKNPGSDRIRLSKAGMTLAGHSGCSVASKSANEMRGKTTMESVSKRVSWRLSRRSNMASHGRSGLLRG
jgi:hypothetical protein